MAKTRPIKVCWTAFSLLCLALLLAGAARAEDAKPKEKGSLAGTTWAGTDSDGDDYVFNFEADGTLSYTSPSGSFRNGTWKQFGGAVYFEMNDHFSEYLGVINGKSIEGKAWNSEGRTWTWKCELK